MPWKKQTAHLDHAMQTKHIKETNPYKELNFEKLFKNAKSCEYPHKKEIVNYGKCYHYNIVSTYIIPCSSWMTYNDAITVLNWEITELEILTNHFGIGEDANVF